MSNWSFSFANGALPVFSSQPSVSDLDSSGISISFDNNDIAYYGGSNSCIDYFYYLNTTSNQYMCTFVSSSSFTVYIHYGWLSYVQSQYGSNTYNNIYYYQSGWGTSHEIVNSDFPYLGSFASYADAINYYVANGVNYGPEPLRYPFTIQNGYLFVYDLGQSGNMYSFDLSSTSLEYSDIGSNPFPDTNQSYWFSNSLPEMDETTIPDSSASIIHWDKGSKTNIFGQTQEMVATISGTSTGRYLCIYNPPVHYKWSGSSNPTASEVINYTLTINGVYSGDSFYIYDSAARLFDYNQGGNVQGTVVGETGYGSVATDGAISVTTTDGAIYNQTAGGSTDISGASGGSIAENIRGLQETLDYFVEQFVQLLSAPISHIQQLIRSGQNFFSFFTQLFDWLPAEVSGVIASALIVMIVIGVLKMLL